MLVLSRAKSRLIPRRAALGKVTPLQTPSGVAFGLLGSKGPTPAPTLLVIANDIQTSLTSEDYNRIGKLLATKGFLCVALDAPCHGRDAQPGEPANSLAGWRVRTEKGDAWLPTFTGRVRDVIAYLVKERYTDPQRLAVAGTSRGGFLACHVAAAEPRFRAVIAFAPVTELMLLNEFHGTAKVEAAKALDLSHVASKLAARSLWLCIGNHDDRVGTDAAIAFTRKVVGANSTKTTADVMLIVTPTVGHSIHKTAHQEAAAWLLERIQGVN